MARDRQRAKQRRRRQPGGRDASPAGGQGRDMGLDEGRVEDAGLGGSTPTPDPLDHASADVDEARLAERGPRPPDLEYEFDHVERAPDEAEEDRAPVRAGEEEEEVAAEAPSRRGGGALTFLRNSWQELKRVKWPNRRQVGQATAVTLGFVVLAGGYLGLMDAIWQPLVNAIL